ncbi:P1 family peptidase [Sulfitobacter donghicola]|uniref:Peptidase T4 n=1 Tax=Sulfitobacter donghicola DSW-25 = KCTC 12864 = JCM 14565 TaxID=1300350 RepID=A0A073IKG3_9RHOB|nr:P1 family peptidase [Sulfitobacter donghicola]KEJ90828.1 peptidase T4 [Sulfitobacter donghicola DSW-25 = KCTC 12864 = JCM 14565]KIN68104.1 Peptidase, T4 family [Sulfitobacter donghicola DSW-25 = KCTC 12864 = JCM 14565]
MKTGPTNSITDIKGLRVGNAQDHAIKTGTTVIVADEPFVASSVVMGGAPGTRETDLLAPDKSVAAVDALVLSGGSAFGLDACSGVVDGLRAHGRGFSIGPAQIPLVPGAILFDLLNGGDKGWSENPYRALGRAAYDAAQFEFEIGTVGAGTGALTAMLKGGLGTASLQLPDGSMVAALVAANPVGAVTTPGDRHFYAAPFEMGDEFGGIGPDPNGGLGLTLESRKQQAMVARSNTTIAIVATDAALTKAECHRVATAAHDGIGRACVPAHTPHDGDLVFALSTAEKEPADVLLTGHAAALCLSRAIARAVYAATPQDGDIMPCWKTANADL